MEPLPSGWQWNTIAGVPRSYHGSQGCIRWHDEWRHREDLGWYMPASISLGRLEHIEVAWAIFLGTVLGWEVVQVRGIVACPTVVTNEVVLDVLIWVHAEAPLKGAGSSHATEAFKWLSHGFFHRMQSEIDIVL